MNIIHTTSIFLLLLCSVVTSSFAQNFYDLTTIQTIEVYLSASNWDQQLDNAYATTGDYIMADSVSINGTTFDSVGVKYKGNSSYNANQTKNPWHIELDTYKEQEYQGYKDIKLANVAKDPSFLRDVLGYQIVRQYMDAPLANYANVYVNGTLIGLYANTEAITKTFVKDRFGSKKNTFVNCSPPDGAGPQSSDYPNLVYLGTDSSSYDEAYEIKSDAGWIDLINLCDNLKNNVALIENSLDVDRALWMLAFDNAIVNLDSYIGQFSQNYYLYQDDYGRFLPVVWDLNESFGTFSRTGTGSLNSTAAKRQMSHLLHATSTNFPLVSQLLSIPTYKKRYLAHLKTLLQENFTNNGNYYTMAQALQTTIDAAVQADPNKFYTYAQFTSNLTTDIGGGGPGPGGSSVPGITSLMNGRYTYLMAQSDFTATQPTITNIAVDNTSPAVGSTVTLTATLANEVSVYVYYRNQAHAPFVEVQMLDDGNHNDGTANDQVYGAVLPINSLTTEYYIYAENNTIGKFSPVRAQHEFYTLSATVATSASDVVINEFMASNDTYRADQDGEYDDWLELYNNGTTAIDISGYGLSDDATDLHLYTFPNGTILAPNSYLVVWADKDLNQTGYHADFKISASGETLYLSNTSQQVLDSIAFGSQNADEGYGRYPNGTGPFQVLPATFGAENRLSQTTPIHTIEEELGLTIYPNPTQGAFTVELEQSHYEEEGIRVLNSLGQVVYEATFTTSITIHTQDWVEGLYYVQVHQQTKKLILTK